VTPPEPPSPADRRGTRERLIEAAMELFVLHGYGPTGLAQIARRAEAHPGSLYHFFPTKEDLLAATLEKRKELLWPEVLEPIWSRIDDPLERVFGLLEGYRRMLELTEFRHGCPIGNLVLELAESHPHARGLLAENFDNWLDFVQRCFAEARERLPEETDPRALAVFVLTTMEGAVMLARTYRSFEAYDAAIVSLRDYVERLVRQATSWPAPAERVTERRGAPPPPTDPPMPRRGGST
jgi:AcrR family transcriptional regulator